MPHHTYFPCYKLRLYCADKEVAQRTFLWEDPTVNVTVHTHTRALAHILSPSLTCTFSHTGKLYTPTSLSLSLHTLSHIHTHTVSHTNSFLPRLLPHTHTHRGHTQSHIFCIHTHTHIFCMHTQNKMPCPVKMFIYTGHYSCSNTPVMLRMKIVREQPKFYNLHTLPRHT